MSETFFVRIDVPKLCERLRADEPGRRRVTHGDAFEWLLGHDFKMTRRGWLVQKDSIELLREHELVSCVRI